MMQRSICILCLALSMICLVPRSFAQQGKSEIAVGYGFYSFYSFLNEGLHYNARYTNSSGTSVLTYRYYITKDVTLGLGFGYENISIWGSFVTFSPEVTFSYLDTRNTTDTRVKLYGAFSYGISIFQDANVGYGHADQSGGKPWAFQATPFGVRVGRQIAGFAEVGFGYKGVINAGLAVRFPRKLAHHEHHVE